MDVFLKKYYQNTYKNGWENYCIKNFCQIEEVHLFADIHPKLDLVNMDVRPLLFTELSLFTKSSLDK